MENCECLIYLRDIAQILYRPELQKYMYIMCENNYFYRSVGQENRFQVLTIYHHDSTY